MTDLPFSIGISGWSYPDWNGWVYPPGCRDQLAYVAPYVDFIEINSTFYAMPSARTVASWVARTSHLPDFFFTAKVHHSFTHEGVRDGSAQFLEGLQPLLAGGKLRALLAQFPASFDDTSENASRLRWLRDTFSEIPLVVEVRHVSWPAPAALAFLNRLGVSVANLDYPATAESFSLDTCRVGKIRYLRLHGRNREAWANPKAGRDDVYNYLYSNEELDALAKRAQRLAKDASHVMTAANNHYQGKELVNALELRARSLRRKIAVPPVLQERYPRLGEVAAQ